MTLDERLSLLWKTLQKLTPEEIDKELDGAGAPLKERTALFSTEIISNPTEMLIKDFKSEENLTLTEKRVNNNENLYKRKYQRIKGI